jgi:UDP-galactopyranose mutase
VIGCGMDIICVSHLRWDFVFQRPQHLLTRAARERRVFYLEEPRFTEGPPALAVRTVDGVVVVVPTLPVGRTPDEHVAMQISLVQSLVDEHAIDDFVLWYYTPMALKFTGKLMPSAVVYDCMDELSAFAGAPPELTELERQLFRRADVVFTGGHTLFEAKRAAHQNVHPFPSSVDVPHFARARFAKRIPDDQAAIARPRLGYFGVIDERIDYPLLRAIAAARPDWQIVLVGPTAKVNVADLPAGPNLHYLGQKSYADLPDYIAGWDVALLPFARNDSTRYISPTKTPEYLAAGKPVVSTSITDVVSPYGDLGLARIADSPDAFIAAVEQALSETAESAVQRRSRADVYLADLSWDRTWSEMSTHVARAAEGRLHRV